MDAIIYTTNTGSVERYARLLAQETGLPVYSSAEAKKQVFTIQGNFDVNKLHGMYRMMMELMIRTAGKALAGKKDRTTEEDDMLDMMLHGGERVKAENLSAVLDWYRVQR